ncbi:MAG: WYL domain-containing protein [Clostridia bacterium]|nr:WYL domain-containing protein [Clostridia bacterium]MDY6184799.1 WYL domain-containing protein [Eubacteriales bacterium]
MDYLIKDGILETIDATAEEWADPDKRYEIPEGVTVLSSTEDEHYIGDCAVLSLPATLDEIDPAVFSRTRRYIREIRVARGNARYTVSDGCLIDREEKKVVLAGAGAGPAIPGGVTTIGEEAYLYFDYPRIDLMRGVTTLEGGAFFGTDAEEILIGRGVTSIARDAFGFTRRLQNITVDPDNPAYYSKNNCLIERKTQMVIAVANTADIVIPNGVRGIGLYAFTRHGACRTITLPASVRYIAYDAFLFCGPEDDGWITPPVIIAPKNSAALRFAEEQGLPNRVAPSAARGGPGSAKKLSILYILEVLRRYSDAEHPMTMEAIIRRVAEDYDLSLERKSVAACVHALEWMGYEILSVPRRGVYFLPAFTDGELRLIADSILFARHISASETRDILAKISSLGGCRVQRDIGSVAVGEPLYHTPAKYVLFGVETLSEAIRNKRRVSFIVSEYGLDKALHPVSGATLTVSPHQLVMSGGFYYLVATPDGAAAPTHYRVDKIGHITMTDAPAIVLPASSDPLRSVRDYLAFHPHMGEGRICHVKARIDRSLVGEVVDTFGTTFRVLEEGEYTATLLISSTEDDMFRFAMEQSGRMTVLEPASLRRRIRLAADDLLRRYGDDDRAAGC